MLLILLIIGCSISKVNSYEEDLKLRGHVHQCSDKALFKKLDPKSPKTALASLPGNTILNSSNIDI